MYLEHLKKYQATDDIEALTVIGILYGTIQSQKDSTSTLKQDFLQILNQWMEQGTHPTSVLANTACYLIVSEEDSVSENTVDTLVDILMRADFTDPMADLHLDRFWVDALLSLGIDQATKHLLAIFDYQQDEYAIVEVGAMLLELHFGGKNIHSIHVSSLGGLGKHECQDRSHIRVDHEHSSQIRSIPRQGFTKLQREILKHFVQKEQLWNIKTNLLEIYQLPASRSGMVELIE